MTVESGTGVAGTVAHRQWLAGAIGAEISDAALRQVLLGLPGVDQVGTAERTASLATRSSMKCRSVKERSSAAVRRSAIRSDKIHFRRRMSVSVPTSAGMSKKSRRHSR